MSRVSVSTKRWLSPLPERKVEKRWTSVPDESSNLTGAIGAGLPRRRSVNTGTAAAPAGQHLCLEAEAVGYSRRDRGSTCSVHLQTELQDSKVGARPLNP